MFTRIHSSIWFSQVESKIILLPLLAPLCPVWVETNEEVRKQYTDHFSKVTTPARGVNRPVWICFGGTGGQGNYFNTSGWSRCVV